MATWRVVDLDCKEHPGVLEPFIDRARCEGEADCVEACPHGVFALGTITDADFRALPVLAKLKSYAHGKRTVYTPAADECRACRKCLKACPENAISLVRRDDATTSSSPTRS